MISKLKSSLIFWPDHCKSAGSGSAIPYSGKVWGIDSFRAFGKRKFSELIDQPVYVINCKY